MTNEEILAFTELIREHKGLQLLLGGLIAGAFFLLLYIFLKYYLRIFNIPSQLKEMKRECQHIKNDISHNLEAIKKYEELTRLYEKEVFLLRNLYEKEVFLLRNQVLEKSSELNEKTAEILDLKARNIHKS